MSETTPATGKMDAISLLRILSKWRKQLIIVALGALVVSFIFTLPVFMTPMFKSSAVVYPVNIQPYSNESPTEQLVQLFNSEDVRDSLIKQFNLYQHYDIDPKGKFPRFEIMKRLGENINIEKNEYESVDITVYDADPVMAKRICDSLIYFMDQKAVRLLRTRAKEIAAVMKIQLDVQKNELDSLEQSILQIRQTYGITDFENQIEGFSREYYRSLASGNVNSKMELTKENLEAKGGEYITLKEHLWRARGAYNDTKLKYQSALLDINKIITFHNLITAPAIPERKDSPKRTLIMLVFMFSCLLMASVIILYQETYRPRLSEELGN
jgi:capsular polysaccharide biosynthesis protein